MSSLTSLLSPLQRAWQARDPRERRTLAIGAGIIVLLLGYLAISRLAAIDVTDDAAPPPAAASRLPAIQPLTQQRWLAAAERHGIDAPRLESQAHGLRLQGRVPQPQNVTTFARWAAQHGWWTTEWSLARESDGGLALDMTLVAELERQPIAEHDEATP
ncbi:hypothetical protein [Halomonas elongata]|uniref:Type II secretion system protein M n=1 Tax=Halomonas elongata (strain ATCC 33173 / DSM 2581 / NBRC 15536 / NCIMB 2198 / 1H9) TaxID=768066 RepID=E1V5F7_HALED|nr:hypothetical protein [Halomonas elongata]MBW5799965.1 type II secretion system protein M [Halomonas elongata]RAW07453.1 hypothetical protein DKQ62_08530 [Halomonas elongata]WBF16852.1 type II secretion system protein M [Halomonas elongata]WPU45683.1 hypothetical protein SR933_10445 [Halomonas elongata DSM 2581]CBV43112.1 uncharacterized protein HELO_3228 [Halomonas elongata DSM 2581]